MDDINICFCSNDKYVKFIPTVINSFIKKNLHNTITIHYIKDFEESDDLNFLRNFVSKFDNLRLKEYYKTWDFEYKGFSHIKSSASMIRLFIPDIIKEKKVLYLDLDLIINLDLSEIFKLALISFEKHTIKARNIIGIEKTIPIFGEKKRLGNF